jgi:hypothetical protein
MTRHDHVLFNTLTENISNIYNNIEALLENHGEAGLEEITEKTKCTRDVSKSFRTESITK